MQTLFIFFPQFMGIRGEVSLAARPPQDADHMLGTPNLPPSMSSWSDRSLNVYPSHPSFEANAAEMSLTCPHFLSSGSLLGALAAEFKAWAADLQEKLAVYTETLGVAISLHPWQPVKPAFV